MKIDSIFFVLAFLQGGFLFCQALRPTFSVITSDDFLLVGRSVKITQKTTVTETTPLKYKIKVPFNDTAYMRILDLKINTNESLQITGNKVPNLTSSSGDKNVNDEADFDLGQVTPTGPMDDVTVSFSAQLLDHPNLTNGEALWISMGAEFTNGSIWANLLAVNSFKNIDPEPVLNGSLTVPQLQIEDVVTGSTVDFGIQLTHDPFKTTSVASGINITFFHPPFFVFSSMTKDSDSVDGHVIGSSSTSRTIVIGAFNFSEVAHFNMTFQVDPSKTKPRGQVHSAFLRTEVQFSYTSPFNPGLQQKTMDKPLKSTVKFYPKRDSCDLPLAVTDDMLEASSYSTNGPPSEGRLNGQKAWVPINSLKKDRSQFIGVNFTGLKIIHRIALQGAGNSLSTPDYVRRFRIFFSKDCVLWKQYRTKDNSKYLKGNRAANKIAVVPLDPPIEAKCIRINPTSFNKQISFRFELYGCASSNPAPTVPLVSRTFLFDPNTKIIYACNIPMIRKNGKASCYLSKNNGDGWTPFDPNVLNIKLVDPVSKQVYGLGARGNYFSCTIDPTISCSLVPLSEYEKVKVVPGVIFAKEADKVSVTDDPNSKIPVDPDYFTSDGKKVGASALGIHWFDGSTWNKKASWAFDDEMISTLDIDSCKL